MWLAAWLGFGVAFGQSLSVDGTCEDTMLLEVTDLTPGGSYALFSSPTLGAITLDRGPCVGTSLDLGVPGLRFRRMATADSLGRDSVSVPGRPEICGHYVQAQDLTTCETTGVVEFEAEPEPVEGYLVVAEGRRGLYGQELVLIDLDAGEAFSMGDLDYPLTGMSYDPSGNLWGVEAMGWGMPRIGIIDPVSATISDMYVSGHDGPHSGFSWLGDRLFIWSEAGDELHELDALSGEDYGSIYYGGSLDMALCADRDGNLYRNYAQTWYLIDPDAGSETTVCTVSDLPSTNGNGCTFHDGDLYSIHGTDSTRTLWRVDLTMCSAESTGIVLPDGADAIAGVP